MCTAIKLDYELGCILSRTMDYDIPLNYNVIYLPQDYKYGQDLYGKDLYSKYKFMGVCFENKNPLKDGINQWGLMGVANTFTAFNIHGKSLQDGKVNLSSLDYLNYALANYSSVDQLIEDLPNIYLSKKNSLGESILSPDFHFMFSDGSKRAVVIEPKEGSLVYYDNPYGVMTNSPVFPSHVKRLEKFMDIGDLEGFNGAKNLPGSYDPVSRFIKAFYLLNKNVKSPSYGEAFAHSYNIMSAMTMPKGFVRNNQYDYLTFTRYISSYDSNSKTLSLRGNMNPMVYSLNFEDIKNENERLEFFIEEKFDTKKLTT